MSKKIYKLDDAGRVAADKIVKEWTDIAFSTGRMTPAERDTVKDSVEALYRAGGLTPPPRHRIVIAPSPFVARFSAGAASWIWYRRKHASATDNATEIATEIATDSATEIATRNATRSATDSATEIATYSAAYSATEIATRNAAFSATDSATDMSGCIDSVLSTAGQGGLDCAEKAWKMYQGGNMWAWSCAFIAFGRDHVGLSIDYSKYEAWETLARLSGFRFMHEDFCIVSEKPVHLTVDAQNRGHCETGPYIRWADGTGIYQWHGVTVPAHWIEQKETLDPNEVLRAENVEQRAAGLQIVGLPRMKSHPAMNYRVIDGDPNSRLGALVEMTLDGLPEPGRFLEAVCPRNGTIIEGVPRVSDVDNLPIETAIAAQAWRIGDRQDEYTHSPRRT